MLDCVPFWVNFKGHKDPRNAAAVKTAWRKGWIGLREEKLTINKKTQGEAFKSIRMGNIRGVSMGRGAR